MLWERIKAIAGKARGAVSRLLGIVVVLAIVGAVGLASFVGAKAVLGDDEEEQSQQTKLTSTDHSWVPGQASLVVYDEFAAVADLAFDLGDARLAAHQDQLSEIEKARLAAERREARQAQRELRRQRREARREYKEALREAARERRRQERAIAREKARIKAKIERLREKYEVDPGRECEIPEVAEVFNCETGKPDF